MTRRPLFAAVLLAALAAPLSAQPIPVSIEVQPAEITVGGQVTARLTLVWDGDAPAAEPRFPTWQEAWGKAEIVEVGAVEAFPDQSGRHVYIQSLTLTAFETGEVRLPVVKVAVPLADETVEVPTQEGAGFHVRSVLAPADETAPGAPPGQGPQASPAPPPAAEELEPRPSLPPRDLAGDRAFAAAAGALAVLLALALWTLLRRLRREAALGPADLRRLPPLEELAERLAALDLRGHPEPVHTGLSFALRTYLGRRLGFQALESTTSEIHRRLRGLPLSLDLAQQTVRLLRDCDQVKFARQEVAAAVTRERIDLAGRTAREIDGLFRPPEEAAGPAEAAA